MAGTLDVPKASSPFIILMVSSVVRKLSKALLPSVPVGALHEKAQLFTFTGAFSPVVTVKPLPLGHI